MAYKTLINDPIINELAFDALFHLSQPEHRGKLTPTELRASYSAKKAKHFAGRTTLDEKLLLFTKLGIEWSFVIHATDFKLKKTYDKFKELTVAQQVDKIAKERVLVLTDRRLATFANVLSKLSHSDTYLLNLDFHRVGDFMNNWSDRPNSENSQTSIEAAHRINKHSLKLCLTMKMIRGESLSGDLDLLILMYLFDNSSDYVSRPTLDIYFGSLYKSTLIAASIKRLWESSRIDKDPTIKKPAYQITSLGITTVMDFHAKNLQSV